MRIVAGKYRHRLIVWPEDNINIRPTKDRIREAIFSALGDLSGCSILDLYAGSGAMGLEALSRNAKDCVFVDINDVAIKTIKKNISSLSIRDDEARILKVKDIDALKMFKQENKQFDVIFLDPPYKLGEYEKIIASILDTDLLSQKGIIVTECDHQLNLPLEKFNKTKEYKYGEILVNILWR